MGTFLHAVYIDLGGLFFFRFQAQGLRAVGRPVAMEHLRLFRLCTLRVCCEILQPFNPCKRSHPQAPLWLHRV